MPTDRPTKSELFANDTVWAMFYRDGKTLGEIAQHFNVSVYALSPWLTGPITQAVREANAE